MVEEIKNVGKLPKTIKIYLSKRKINKTIIKYGLE